MTKEKVTKSGERDKIRRTSLSRENVTKSKEHVLSQEKVIPEAEVQLYSYLDP